MCLPEDFTLFDRSVHILNHKSFARYSECNRSLISSETNDTASLIPYQGPVVQSIVSLTSSLSSQLVKCFMTL